MASSASSFPEAAVLPANDDCLAGGGEMGARMRTADRSTALGAPSTWTQGLRSALSICLGSRFPIALYWGPDPGTIVRLFVRREGDGITVTVCDQGVGIPPEMLGRVFDIFYQQPQALDRAKGGLGLGLAIVKSLVDLHGGRVTAGSEGPGKGSDFSIHLPAAPPRDLRPPAPVDSVAHREIARPARQAVRVLIVDDNVDAADSVAELLQEMGHEVRAVNDPLTALKVAPAFRPELCLLDIGLPVMDGYELAGKLRASQALAPNGRIIAVTGYGQDADRRRASAAGFDAHLVKPVTLDLLVEALDHR
jgi:CheY-like chemotaxis protein